MELKETQRKVKEMYEALLTIKRLMPEVEADLSQMSRVGAAPGKTKEQREHEIRKKFFKTTKIK